MKRYESDDELDAALFALPLKEPPADLRASILAATIYRAPAPFKAWEVWTIGATLAVIVWLATLIFQGGGYRAVLAVDAIASGFVTVISQPSILVWAGVGAAIALWLTQANLTPLSLPRKAKDR